MMPHTKPAVVCVVTGAILVGALNWLTGVHGPQLAGDLVHRVVTDEPVIALTFDDGPHPPYTTELLDVLERHRVPATFYVLGEAAERHPNVVRDIIRRGHEIGNHTWSHARLLFRSPAFVRREIERTDQLLRRLGYDEPTTFRAPHGRKLITLPAVLSALNKPHVLFDVVPRDWEKPPVDVIVERVLGDVRPGSIILLHDGGGDRTLTVQATEALVGKLKRSGFRFVTVSQLLDESPPLVAQTTK